MIEWFEDNSMRIEQTIVGSGSSADVTATILDSVGAPVGEPITLEPTGTPDQYAAIVHPVGDYDLVGGLRYKLRIEGEYGGSFYELEHDFRPRVRRGA